MNINLTLVGQAISFALFVLFCMRFVWPPVMNALRERQKSISEGLLAADQAKQNLAQTQEENQLQLQQGKRQAEEILAGANKQAQVILENAKAEAEKEGQRIVRAAEEAAQQSMQKARSELRTTFAGLVSSGVAKILGREADINQHKSILNSLEKQL